MTARTPHFAKSFCAALPTRVLLTCGLAVAACGGGSGPSLSPAPPSPLLATPPDFSAVTAEIERHPIADMALMIGDADGVLLSYEKGARLTSDPLRIASASKLLTGLAVWSLVEDGELSPDSRPSDILAVWDGADARRDVTLSQLMSFTSGLGTRSIDATCAGRPAYSLKGCVADIHDQGLIAAPGKAYVYGPDHMQVAALMAEAVTGVPLSDTVRKAVFDRVGATDGAGFPAFGNVRYSANAVVSADDYARVLTALMDGELIADLDGFTQARSDVARVDFQPLGLTRTGRDWRYGFGFWIECDAVPFNTDCAERPTISSAGGRGFVPWVDLDAGYWAVIAMEENGQADDSTDLQQMLQPLIEDALR